MACRRFLALVVSTNRKYRRLGTDRRLATVGVLAQESFAWHRGLPSPILFARSGPFYLLYMGIKHLVRETILQKLASKAPSLHFGCTLAVLWHRNGAEAKISLLFLLFCLLYCFEIANKSVITREIARNQTTCDQLVPSRLK